MAMRHKTSLLGLFFCLTGIGYAGPVALADGMDAMRPASEGLTAESYIDADGGAAELPEGQTVEVGSFGQIDLHVKELPLTQVLQLLSIQSQRNIIASRNVSGSISADLYGVDFYEALDAILHTNGFGYRERGNFIYVYTAQQIQEMEEAERQTVTRIVRLNYITASDVAAFVSPLLSNAGSLSVSGEAQPGMQATIANAGANSYAHADTIIIRDYPENVDEIIEVVGELDIRPKQVLIEATVLQATLNEANAFGVDFAIFAELDATDFSTPLGAVNDLITGSAGSGGAVSATPGGVQSGQSSIKLGYAGNDAAVFVRALDSVTDTTILATPKILALNRQRAELLVGERLGYLSTTQTETSATQTVEFLDVGTQLNVRPFISEDNYVRLELKPQVSDGFTTVEAGTIIPHQTTQELTTNVIVKSGQTVVLGGLFKEDTTVDRRQVPGLGNIPIVGGAFRGQDDTVRRSEVIFLIKPTVLRDEALYVAGERASDQIETARVGVRRNLLPWSRTKLTSSHMSQAHEHLREGNQEKALWNVNVALHLHPTSVEALRLKEQITGERVAVPDRGILRGAVDEMIDSQVEIEPELGSTEPVEIGEDVESAEAEGTVATEASAEADVSMDESAEVDWSDEGAWSAETEQANDGASVIHAADAVEADEVVSSGEYEAEFDESVYEDADVVGEPAEGDTFEQGDSPEAFDAVNDEMEAVDAVEPVQSDEDEASGAYELHLDDSVFEVGDADAVEADVTDTEAAGDEPAEVDSMSSGGEAAVVEMGSTTEVESANDFERMMEAIRHNFDTEGDSMGVAEVIDEE